MKPCIILIFLNFIFHINLNGQITIFKVFEFKNTKIDLLRVHTITINNEEKWIGTFSNNQGGGVLVYNNIDWVIYNRYNNSFPAENVTSIQFDNVRNKWIGTTHNGLICFNIDNTWAIYNTSNSPLPSDDIQTLLFDNIRNALWLGTTNGLVYFDFKEWLVYNTQNSPLSDNSIKSLVCDKYGNLWIGTNGKGVCKFDGITWNIFNTSNSMLTNNGIGGLFIDSKDNIFVGGNGIAKFNNESWEQIYPENLSHNDWIQCIVEDKLGNYWFGSLFEGLYKYDGSNWINYTTENSNLPSNTIWTINVDKNNILWIGTEKGIVVFDEEKFNTSDKYLSPICDEIFVFPVPCDNILNISLPYANVENVQVSLINSLGIVIYNNFFRIFDLQNILCINSYSIPNGLYNIIISINNRMISKKILVTHH